MAAKLRIESRTGSIAPWEVPLLGPTSSIGRDASCAVVLPDPSRHLSRHHMTIESQGGALTLIVNSKVNPVILGGRELGYQQRTPLANGDVIVIADFQITVVADNAAPAFAPQGFASQAYAPPPVAPQMAAHDDPFAWLNSASVGSAAAPAGGYDPLAELSRPKPPAPEIPDPFRQAQSQDHRLIPGLGALPATPHPQPGGFGAVSVDPLGLISGGNGLATPAPERARSSSSIDDLLHSIGSPASSVAGSSLVDFTKPRPQGSTAADHVHDFDLPYSPPPVIAPATPPAAAAPAASVAPSPFPLDDDPFADLLGPLATPQPAATPMPAVAAAPADPFTSLAPVAAAAPSAPAVPTPVAASFAVADLAATAMPLAASAAASAAPSTGSMIANYARAAAPAPTPAYATPAGAPASVTPDGLTMIRIPGQDGDPLAPFFKGLGLDDIKVPPAEAAEYMEVVGQITRAAIAGVVQLLVSRGEMKKELRADDRTMLAANNNNPLKMMVSEAEALSYLFDSREQTTGAFMPPLQAISDACQDIMAHEFGLVAGLRAAVIGALKRCDPQALEQQAEKLGKVGGLLANRKAQMWDYFVEWYKKMDETAADDVDRLFERDFLKAYVTQVRKMRGK